MRTAPHWKQLLERYISDISKNLEFDFSSCVKNYDVRGGDSKNDLATWLGVTHNIGQAMCYYVLKSNGRVIVQSTIRPLNKEEWLDKGKKQEPHQI